MRLPAELIEIRSAHAALTARFRRRSPAERAVHPVLIVVLLERCEFALQVTGVPEQRVVKKLPADSPDQPLNSAGELIHHDEDPVGLQPDGFTAEQVNAPEAVFDMTDG
jgi:hypothetical protein